MKKFDIKIGLMKALKIPIFVAIPYYIFSMFNLPEPLFAGFIIAGVGEYLRNWLKINGK